MTLFKTAGVSDTRYLSLLLVAVVSVATAIGTSQYLRHPGSISNDTTHYLVGAVSMLEDARFNTRILYFDEHYASGVLPAPQTVWPPGTSLGIAALGALGVPLDDAGRLWCVLCYPVLLVLVLLVVWCFTESIGVTAAAALWQLAVVEVWPYASTIGSELIFMTLMLACVLIYAGNLRCRASEADAGGASFWALAAISALSGIAFLYRYAAILLIAWTMLLIVVELSNRAWRRSERLVPLMGKALLAVLPAMTVVASLIGRNILITGGARGGNTKLVLNSVRDLLATTVTSLVTTLTGVDRLEFFGRSPFLAALAVLALCFLGLVFVGALVELGRTYHAGRGGEWRTRAYVMVMILTLIYAVGMIAISSRTMLSFGTRYLIPMVPLCIVLGLSLWRPRPWSLWGGIAVLVACQIVALANRTTLSHDPHPSVYKPVTDMLDRHAERDDVIMVIGDGQRIGYYGKRPTLAIPTPKYTSRLWDEEGLLGTAVQFGVRYLVVNRAEDPKRYDAFAASLIEGAQVPWLEEVETIDSAFLYRLEPAR